MNTDAPTALVYARNYTENLPSIVSFTVHYTAAYAFEFHARQSPFPMIAVLYKYTSAERLDPFHSQTHRIWSSGRHRVASAASLLLERGNHVTDGSGGDRGAGATAPVGLVVASHRWDAPHQGLRGRRPPPRELLAAVAAVAHPPQGPRPRRRRVRVPHPPPPALLRQRQRQRRDGQGGRRRRRWNRRSRKA